MSQMSEALRREIVRKCLREQFDVPLPNAAAMPEDEAVEAAVDLIERGWLRLEQIKKPRRRRPGLYRLVPVLSSTGDHA
jgi:hypothetical protein